jgi:hypothetical protein
MRAAFHEACLFKPIKDPDQGDWFKFQKVGECALLNAVIVRQVSQDLPLRARQAQAFRLLLEPLAEQSGYIVQQETERFFRPFQWGTSDHCSCNI